MIWNVEEILHRLEVHGESQKIEAKFSQNQLGKSVLETISAFSNEPGLAGGYIVLGLRSQLSGDFTRYEIQGVDNPDRLQQELIGACRTSFNIQVSPEVFIHETDGKILVIAYIPEATAREKPIYIRSKGIENGCYRRIGSADYLCTAEDLDLIYQLRRQQPYELDVLPGVSWDDISSEAVEEYRKLRAQIEPDAQELKLNDFQLLISLKAAVKKENIVIPNIGGLLLFGTKAALRREMPIAARVDYLLVEGSEWVPNSSERYQFVSEYREALITLLPRLHRQIMNDLPTKFVLETGKLQRTDTSLLPRDVIREAIANALMHRDYRTHQPTLIICYSNRIEFRNAGYSLKPFEELGEPGSKPRNPTIAAVFHELKHAETKGTGIRTMREEMQKAGLTTPPIIESDRDRNEFDLILLPHHLLSQKALTWLGTFKSLYLTDAQRRALVFAYEVGAITHEDYRQLNGTDNQTTNADLRGLCDINLLIKKGKNTDPFYLLSPKIKELTLNIDSPDKELTPLVSSPDKELTPLVSSPDKKFIHLPETFPELPKELKEQI